jgi:hypothetical protein
MSSRVTSDSCNALLGYHVQDLTLAMSTTDSTCWRYFATALPVGWIATPHRGFPDHGCRRIRDELYIIDNPVVLSPSEEILLHFSRSIICCGIEATFKGKCHCPSVFERQSSVTGENISLVRDSTSRINQTIRVACFDNEMDKIRMIIESVSKIDFDTSDEGQESMHYVD